MPQRTHALALALVLVGLCAGTGRAGSGPDKVLVVVNEDSWASQTVANEFIRLRQIPEGNVVYLSGLPSFEHTSVNDFRERILKPVLTAIKDRGLAGRIDCVAYSSDLPWAVDVGQDVGQRKLPNFITRTASINGLTYLHELVLAKDIEYLGLGANYYVRRPHQPRAEARWSTDDLVALNYANGLLQLGQWAEALPALERLAQAHPDAASLHYNIACCLARLNRPDDALAALARAVKAGWADRNHTRSDADLETLYEREDFKRLLEEMQQPVFDVQPATAFHSTQTWAKDGRLAEPGQGRRYMLSTMLAVTSGRGNSVREALDGLRRSAAADGTAPSGTVYFLQNGDIRSKTRAWAFGAAAQKLKALRVAAEVLDGVLPKDRHDVAGAMVGTAGFDWKSSGSTILPGAICEHLTSTGGVMDQYGGQTPISEFIRYGAAGTSGTVTEPMAIQAKFPLAFIHVHYARGCSLAEAFYQSVAGPYQLLIVGDPLCRPWARVPKVSVQGVEPGATVKGTLKLAPHATAPGGARIRRYRLLVNSSPQGTCEPGGAFELDTTALADGFYQLRIVATTADAIETQGRLVLPITVCNRGQTLVVTEPKAGTVERGKPLRLGAELAGAREIRFHHNGRVLATVAGEKGEAEIDTRRLGLGPVAIQAVAHVPFGPTPEPAVGIQPAEPGGRPEDREHLGWQIAAKPVELLVVPPPALPPIDAPPADKTAKGLALTIDGGKPVAIESTRDHDWLSKAGLKETRPFVLEGYFDVPGEDVYQFQVRTSGDVTLAVDGHALEKPQAGKWTFLPVALAKGTHRLEVSGTFSAKPSLRLRFGGPGAHDVGADRFRHMAPTEEAGAGKPSEKAQEQP